MSQTDAKAQLHTDMNQKAFKHGLIVGRFQVLHKGHGEIIRKALGLCENLTILVGSSQESGTLKNPLSYELRREILKDAFPEANIYPLPDIGVGNVGKWGDYVMEKAKEYSGSYPDISVSGRESRRTSWIEDRWDMAELYIPKTIEISATKMIQFIIDGDRESWESYIEPATIHRYEQIREQVLASKDILDTDSV